MKISEIKKFPVGYKFGGGFELAVKTAKKMWQLPNKTWIHQVLLMDETGEMIADLAVGGNRPVQRGYAIKLIVVEIQADEKHGTKMFVEQLEVPTHIGDPADAMDFANGEPPSVVRGKIKCRLAAGKVIAGATIEEQYEYVRNPTLIKIIDEIVKG